MSTHLGASTATPHLATCHSIHIGFSCMLKRMIAKLIPAYKYKETKKQKTTTKKQNKKTSVSQDKNDGQPNGKHKYINE